jgi:CheY-like chemotaxis protein
VRIAEKGWLVEWMASAQALFDSATTSSPAAVIGVTEKGDFSATELLVELKTRPVGGQVPCFVIGNDDDDEAIERILDLGVEDYFSVPVNVDTVVAKLRRIFNRTLNYDSTPPALGGGPAPPPIPSEGMMEDMVLAAALGDTGHALDQGGLMGPVSALVLFDFVEHMVLRQQSLVLEFMGDAQGHLGMMDGEIVFAEMHGAKGAEAFSNMMLQEEGVFKVDFGAQPPDTNVSLSTPHLLVACRSNPGQ